MTDSASLKVEGDETLRRTLNAAQDELVDLDQSENARLIEQRARANAPKLSGTLANSVTAGQMTRGIVEIASDLVYAKPIHYGWPARNIAPQPFLETALDDSISLVEANNLREANRILGRVRGA